MKEKIFHVKKLENPDFSDLKYSGKNLMTYSKNKLKELPITMHLGRVMQTSGNKNNFYLEGFTMLDSSFGKSKLEKQTILGRKYHGRNYHYEMPLTGVTSDKDVFYEFQENFDIWKLRDIADGKEEKFVIEEVK